MDYKIFADVIDEDRIDESPFVYKPADSILSLVGETVDVQDVLKPVFNLKG
jgi:tRNA-splicing ligase RtcB